MTHVLVASGNEATFLVGPKDFPEYGGKCPDPTHEFKKVCCCGNGCCLDACRSIKKPPQSCLEWIPNSEWVLDTTSSTYEFATYKAVRNFKHQG